MSGPASFDPSSLRVKCSAALGRASERTSEEMAAEAFPSCERRLK